MNEPISRFFGDAEGGGEEETEEVQDPRTPEERIADKLVANLTPDEVTALLRAAGFGASEKSGRRIDPLLELIDTKAKQKPNDK